MMTLLLRDRSDVIRKSQRLREIGEGIGLNEVMVSLDRPALKLGEKVGDPFGAKWWNTTATRNAFLIS